MGFGGGDGVHGNSKVKDKKMKIKTAGTENTETM